MVSVIQIRETENSNGLQEASRCIQGVCGCLILPIVGIMSMIVTCWPQHNVLHFPEYWYEPIGPITFGAILITSSTRIIACQQLMNVDMKLSWRMLQMLKSFVILSSGWVITYVAAYIIWVPLLGYRWPIPFIGHLVYLIQNCIICLIFWFLFPPNIGPNDNQFRTRLLVFISFIPLETFIGLGYSIIPSVLRITPLNIQWCIGIFLPLLKKFNIWWTTKIGIKATDCDTQSAIIIMIINVGCMHSCSTAILLGSTRLAPETAYVIMVIDCLVNTVSCVNIIRMQRSANTIIGQAKQNEMMRSLALKEYLEVLIPAIYCLSFVAAYYGPNAEIMGNVKNDYWEFEKVDDLRQKLNTIVTLLVIDAIRGLIFGLVLWNSCRLNLYRAFCYIVKNYGAYILLRSSYSINWVNNRYP